MSCVHAMHLGSDHCKHYAVHMLCVLSIVPMAIRSVSKKRLTTKTKMEHAHQRPRWRPGVLCPRDSRVAHAAVCLALEHSRPSLIDRLSAARDQESQRCERSGMAAEDHRMNGREALWHALVRRTGESIATHNFHDEVLADHFMNLETWCERRGVGEQHFIRRKVESMVDDLQQLDITHSDINNELFRHSIAFGNRASTQAIEEALDEIRGRTWRF